MFPNNSLQFGDVSGDISPYSQYQKSPDRVSYIDRSIQYNFQFQDESQNQTPKQLNQTIYQDSLGIIQNQLIQSGINQEDNSRPSALDQDQSIFYPPSQINFSQQQSIPLPSNLSSFQLEQSNVQLSVLNSIESNVPIPIGVVQKKFIICFVIFLVFTLIFGGLLVFSVIEYLEEDSSVFVTLCIFQNMFACIFFSQQQVIVKKWMTSFESDAQLAQLILSLSNYGIYQTMSFLMIQRKCLININLFLYIFNFSLGCGQLNYHTISQVYILTQLMPGFVLIIGTASYYIILPFIWCYRERSNRNHDQFELQYLQNMNLINQRVEIVHIYLQSPKRYEEVIQQYVQPCYICLQEYEKEDMVVELQCNATHVFHQECIEPWVMMHPHCPVCRQTLI